MSNELKNAPSTDCCTAQVDSNKNEQKQQNAGNVTANGAASRSLFAKPSYRSSRVDDDWEVTIAMPGVKRGDVSVSLEQDELTVVGRRSDSVPDDWRPLYEERGRADYRLRLQLNFDADPEKITALLEDGILKLRLPESEAAKPRQIEVK